MQKLSRAKDKNCKELKQGDFEMSDKEFFF